MRSRKCRSCPEWHDMEEPWPQACAGHFRNYQAKRSKLASPAFISDDLGSNGLLNHADGRMYTSKAAYVRAVKAAGCEIVGNEKLKPPSREKVKLTDDVRREIRQKVAALDSPTRPARPSREYFNGSRDAMRNR